MATDAIAGSRPGTSGLKILYVAGAEAKARVEDGRAVPGRSSKRRRWGDGRRQPVTSPLKPAVDAVPTVGVAVAWLTAAGLLYRRYASARQREIDLTLMVKPVAWVDPEPNDTPRDRGVGTWLMDLAWIIAAVAACCLSASLCW